MKTGIERIMDFESDDKNFTMDFKKKARIYSMKDKLEEQRRIKEWADACADEIIDMRRERAKPSITPEQLPF